MLGDLDDICVTTELLVSKMTRLIMPEPALIPQSRQDMPFRCHRPSLLVCRATSPYIPPQQHGAHGIENKAHHVSSMASVLRTCGALAAIASLPCVLLVPPAAAKYEWKPRRHTKRIGEPRDQLMQQYLQVCAAVVIDASHVLSQDAAHREEAKCLERASNAVNSAQVGLSYPLQLPCSHRTARHHTGGAGGHHPGGFTAQQTPQKHEKQPLGTPTSCTARLSACTHRASQQQTITLDRSAALRSARSAAPSLTRSSAPLVAFRTNQQQQPVSLAGAAVAVLALVAAALALFGKQLGLRWQWGRAPEKGRWVRDRTLGGKLVRVCGFLVLYVVQ